jgi:hypothetical protein
MVVVVTGGWVVAGGAVVTGSRVVAGGARVVAGGASVEVEPVVGEGGDVVVAAAGCVVGTTWVDVASESPQLTMIRDTAKRAVMAFMARVCSSGRSR